MSAFAALTLGDGAATPVTHTFTPTVIDPNGVALLEDKSGGIAIGFPVVTLSSKRPQKGGAPTYRVTQKVTFPVLEVTAPSTATGIQPAPTKAYDLIATLEFVLPQRATQQERKHIHAFMANLLTSAQGKSMVTDLDTIY